MAGIHRTAGAVFAINSAGTTTYKLIRSLIAPQKPNEKSYDELVQVFKVPPPAERFKFNSGVRQPSENVATYISELWQLATKCNFGKSLDEMLRDRIVCGVNDARIQRRRLAEPAERREGVPELRKLAIRCGGNLESTNGVQVDIPGMSSVLCAGERAHIACICCKAKAGEGKPRTKGRPQTDKT